MPGDLLTSHHFLLSKAERLTELEEEDVRVCSRLSEAWISASGKKKREREKSVQDGESPPGVVKAPSHTPTTAATEQFWLTVIDFMTFTAVCAL